jgi:hypothetical protein
MRQATERQAVKNYLKKKIKNMQKKKNTEETDKQLKSTLVCTTDF